MWKVLIVEDERVDREIYKIFLRDSGHFQFEIAECDSAACGIAKTASWAPDCILLDYHLPDMDGMEMLEALRRGNADLPCAIIMLTAQGGEDLAVKALKSGAMDYLAKGPALSDVLPNSVANAIERFQMQRRIEEQRAALEKSARRHQTLIEAIPHMVWMSDAEGKVEYANRHWFEYSGLSLGKGGPFGWDALLHPDDRERSWAAWTKARESAAAFEIENRLKRADGAYRWHLVRVVPSRGAGQETANWFGTCTEIESQKFAETVNLQKEKDHGIGQLAAGVAHDFNNLLVAILGGASLVMENLGPGHPAQDMLQNVVTAAERAAELTGKMLAYAGKGNMFIERIDLNQVVGETCEPLRKLMGKSIQFRVRCGRNLPSLTTDSRRLRQTLADLLWNAAEAIGEETAGTIWVRTAVMAVPEGSRSTVPAGKYLVLEVRDTGCGMSEETKQRIFDPFFSTKFPGRGLGLAAVAGFVRSNGGEVRVESKPGGGSRFRVLLPAALAEAQAGGGAR